MCVYVQVKKSLFMKEVFSVFSVFSVFTLYDDASNEDRDEFAALEDHLGRVVEVAKGRVRQPHRGHCEQGEEGIQHQWDSGNKVNFLSLQHMHRSVF